MSRRRKIIVIIAVLLVIKLLIGGIILFSYYNYKQSFVAWKSTKQKCIDRRSEYLSDNPSRNCLPCFQPYEDFFECVLNNKDSYQISGDQVTQNDYDDFLDGDDYWLLFCYSDNQINPSSTSYEPEALVIKGCEEDPDYDYGFSCSSDNDCNDIIDTFCSGNTLIKPECINNICQEGEIDCEFGCEDNACNPECENGDKQYYDCSVGFIEDKWLQKECINNHWKEYPNNNSCTCTDNTVCNQGYDCIAGRCDLSNSGCSGVQPELRNECCVNLGFKEWNSEKNKCINTPFNFIPIIAGTVIFIFIGLLIFLSFKNRKKRK